MGVIREKQTFWDYDREELMVVVRSVFYKEGKVITMIDYKDIKDELKDIAYPDANYLIDKKPIIGQASSIMEYV